MPVLLDVMRFSSPAEGEECFDPAELTHRAAEALEAYQRAPWSQISEQTRLARLHRAIVLLQRVEDLEAGSCPTQAWID